MTGIGANRSGVAAARAVLDDNGRLLSADPILDRLNRRAGGDVGQPLAVPALATVVRLARRLGIMVSRRALAADEKDDVEMWARAQPDGSGTAGHHPVHAGRGGWPVAAGRRGRRARAADGAGCKAARQWQASDRVGDRPARCGGTVRRLHRRRASRPAGIATAPRPPSPALADEFITGLDRSLRRPLAQIIADADSIHSGTEGDLGSVYTDYAANIAHAGRHLLSLVDDLVDLQAVERPDFAPVSERDRPGRRRAPRRRVANGAGRRGGRGDRAAAAGRDAVGAGRLQARVANPGQPDRQRHPLRAARIDRPRRSCTAAPDRSPSASPTAQGDRTGGPWKSVEQIERIDSSEQGATALATTSPDGSRKRWGAT